MDKKTKITYKSDLGEILFAVSSPFWVSEIKGASGLPVDVAVSAGYKQQGGSISSQTVKQRTLTINGSILRSVAVNRRKMLDVMAPLHKGTLTVEQNGESWYLEVYPTQAPDFDDGEGAQAFQFSAVAPFPYWRTTAAARTMVGGLQALFKTPFYTGGKWYISKYSGTYLTNVRNTGNVKIPIKAVFKAVTDCTEPELYHVGDHTYIRILGTLYAGQAITVNTAYGQRRATLTDKDGTTSDAFHRLDIDSDLELGLDPGDNILRYTARSNREGLRLYVVAEEGVVNGL
ncbi:phage distal tail protein [Gemmiger formicilis]|uniref:phage distal tail protein n=1 Tax=Gemmiger formicilis TaxID=745368 RepID=UPI003AAF6F96